MALPYKKQVELDLLCNSLIGKWVKVVKSTNSLYEGIEGTLVYESHWLFHILTEAGVKKIPKMAVTIELEYEGKPLNMDVRLLFSTIVYRIKKIK